MNSEAAIPVGEAGPDLVDATADGSQAFRWPIALVGAFIASFGVSGLVDDSGLIEHPWWVVVVFAAIACGVLGIVSTLRSLSQPTQAELH